MAIVALVLWAFTAAAGFYLLLTSNLARTSPAAPAGHPARTRPAAPAGHPARTRPAESAGHPARIRPAESASGPPATRMQPASVAAQGQAASPAEPASGGPASAQELRQAARGRWDPPSLVAARQAPMLPGLRSLLEFAHPTCAIIGLAFWLGFTLVHNKALGWIAFGLVAVTASLGLAWFTANVRAARRAGPDRGAPRFSGRLLVVHGSAAALTVILAAVTALVTRG
jgi:hypothetical protein